jgi:hypothetical protein
LHLEAAWYRHAGRRGWSDEPSSTLSDSIDETRWPHRAIGPRGTGDFRRGHPPCALEITRASGIRLPYVVDHISPVHNAVGFLAAIDIAPLAISPPRTRSRRAAPPTAQPSKDIFQRDNSTNLRRPRRGSAAHRCAHRARHPQPLPDPGEDPSRHPRRPRCVGTRKNRQRQDTRLPVAVGHSARRVAAAETAHRPSPRADTGTRDSDRRDPHTSGGRAQAEGHHNLRRRAAEPSGDRAAGRRRHRRGLPRPTGRSASLPSTRWRSPSSTRPITWLT